MLIASTPTAQCSSGRGRFQTVRNSRDNRRRALEVVAGVGWVEQARGPGLPWLTAAIAHAAVGGVAEPIGSRGRTAKGQVRCACCALATNSKGQAHSVSTSAPVSACVSVVGRKHAWNRALAALLVTPQRLAAAVGRARCPYPCGAGAQEARRGPPQLAWKPRFAPWPPARVLGRLHGLQRVHSKRTSGRNHTVRQKPQPLMI